MQEQFDLIVIGSGTAASVASSRCRSAGWRVAIIDHLPFGGTCALRGCDPKKVLVGAAQALDHERRMRGHGLAGGDPKVDWPALIGFKRGFTDPVPEMRRQSFDEAGIEAFRGRARFVGANEVDVEGRRLRARFVLVATGAAPVRLGIRGEEWLATSTDFMALERLPKRIVMVGGGYIAAEFSHVAARAGAEVVVLQRGPRMLPLFDAELVGWLDSRARDAGIDIRVDTQVTAVEKTAGGVAVRARHGAREEIFEAEVAVHAAGRAPDLEALDLETAGVATDNGRIRLNAHLQSVTNPAIYAAGDAASSGPPLTPVASHDAGVVAANLLEGNRHTPDYRGVPSVVFTIPPIAAVGLSEAAARTQGLKFRANCGNAAGWYTARRVAEPVYGYKVLVEDDSEKILGAHLVGPGVEETINLFALAIRQGLSAAQLRETVFAYPTAASDLAYML